MAWFSEWWRQIGLVGQIMACAAIPMTIVMFLQAILALIGIGLGGESDVGADSGEVDFDADIDTDF
ncbi:MAG: NfeD-like protein, partial [Oscillospiraceae bacterium]|nr:NfeD-like protein [Oscillospiraceae bacterium]